jgi:hypothetical protein
MLQQRHEMVNRNKQQQYQNLQMIYRFNAV